jgi:hypothetical protein
MNLLDTSPLFYPYTILSCLILQVLFVYITNSKFPLSKYSSYLKLMENTKKHIYNR